MGFKHTLLERMLFRPYSGRYCHHQKTLCRYSIAINYIEKNTKILSYNEIFFKPKNVYHKSHITT